jgi:hypothetical protein
MKAVDKIKTYILCSVTLFRKLYRLWDNVEKFGGAREAASNMAHARCMPDEQGWKRESTRPRRYIHIHTHGLTHEHAHTHKYAILNAFPRQQWFRERVSMLRYMYIASLFCCKLWFFVWRACVVASRRCGDNRVPHSFVTCPRGWLRTRDTWQTKVTTKRWLL